MGFVGDWLTKTALKAARKGAVAAVKEVRTDRTRRAAEERQRDPEAAPLDDERFHAEI